MIYDFITKKNKLGFSLFEVVVTMSIVAIFIAACSNVFTKRYKKRVALSQHGRLECYYDNSGQLTQRLFSEKVLVGGEEKITDKHYCEFTPSNASAYLIINAVGGGGAGGDTYGGSAGVYSSTFLTTTNHQLRLFPGKGASIGKAQGDNSIVRDHDSKDLGDNPDGKIVVNNAGGRSNSGANYYLQDCSVSYAAYACGKEPACTLNNDTKKARINYCKSDGSDVKQENEGEETLDYSTLVDYAIDKSSGSSISDLSNVMLNYSKDVTESEGENTYKVRYYSLAFTLDGNFTAEQQKSDIENYIKGLGIESGVATLSPKAGFGGAKNQKGGNGAILIVW